MDNQKRIRFHTKRVFLCLMFRVHIPFILSDQFKSEVKVF